MVGLEPSTQPNQLTAPAPGRNYVASCGSSDLHWAGKIRSIPLRRGRVCATRSGSDGAASSSSSRSPPRSRAQGAMAGAWAVLRRVTSAQFQRVSAAHLMPVVYRPRRSSLHQLPSTLSVPVAARASEAGGLLPCSSWLFKPRGLLPELPLLTLKLPLAPTVLERAHNTPITTAAISEFGARGEGGTSVAPTLRFWFPQLPLTSVKLNTHSPCLVFRREELIWSFPVFGRTTRSSSPATVSPSRPDSFLW